MTITAIRRDLRSALRSFRTSVGLTATAIATLALGIGATTAAFSIVNALFLRPLPLHQAGRLLYLMGSTPEQRNAGVPLSVIAYERIAQNNSTLTGVAAYCRERLTLTGGGDPEALSGARVSENFFGVLGSQPLLGRTFQSADRDSRVAIISYSLWKRRFASQTGVLGRSITLSQEPYTVIGVMPADYPFPFTKTEVWISRLEHYSGLAPDLIRNGAGYLASIARLKDGVSAAQGQSEIAQLYRNYQRDFSRNPDANPRNWLNAIPLREALVSDVRARVVTLTAVVALVLLIACSNVAGLLLAKATGRTRELTIRTALGATRGDLIRQLLVESSALSLAGALLGIWIAHQGLSLFVTASAESLPHFLPLQLDLTALLFALVLSVVTGALFGLAPALQLSRPDLQFVLRENASGLTTSGGSRRLRNVLVGAQIGLSVVLLIGTSLLLESLRRLQSVSLGFNPDDAFTMSVALPPAKYEGDGERSRFLQSALTGLRQLRGVQNATASLALPIGTALVAPFLPEGEPDRPIPQRPLATWNAIMPDYFAAVGIPLQRGRDFGPRDNEQGPKTIIVSRSLAERFWPKQNPIGKRITYARRQIVAEVVGVVGDVHTRGLEADPGMIFYTPYPQFSWPAVTFTIRTAGAPSSAMIEAARAQISTLDRDLPVTRVASLQQILEDEFTDRRTTLFVIGGFAALALVLTLIGLYGVMAWTVAQRTAEFGLRQALGASPADICGLVLAGTVRLAAAGIAAGGIAAVGLNRLAAPMLYRVSPTDPAVFASMAVLFLIVCLFASYWPARRAMRIDPVRALRES